MARRNRGLIILILVIIAYTFMYTESNKFSTCTGDCAKVHAVDTILVNSHNYVNGVFRCGHNIISDTLCVEVKDTLGINWSLLADTICQVSASQGLFQQKVFIMKWRSNGTGFDTVAIKQCP